MAGYSSPQLRMFSLDVDSMLGPFAAPKSEASIERVKIIGPPSLLGLPHSVQ